jgi:hypothetical protein
MHVLLRSPFLAALLTAGASVTFVTGAAAQTMSADPMATPLAPRLIAPTAITFNRNAADAGPAGIAPAMWSAGAGSWSSSTEDGVLSARATFTGLVPGGHYSLFSRHISNKTEVIEPVDHSGTTNSFIASPAGGATATVTLSQQIVHGDQIWLIYHADATDHPKTIGHLGVDAFVQLRLIQP